MKKTLLILLVVFLLLPSSTFAWQGRLQALGNPEGFVMDESDFLVHPSLARNVEDLALFAFAAYTHREIPNYDYDLRFDSSFWIPGHAGALLADAGLLIPLKTGTLGFMFSMGHDWRHLEGSMPGFALVSSDDLSTGFLWSALYALDMSSACGIGFRVDIGTHHEWANHVVTHSSILKNSTMAGYIAFPGDRGYGEARFTLSADGRMGDMSYAISGYGGFLFGGFFNNESSVVQISSGDYIYYNSNGNYGGFVVGGDLWIAYQATEKLRFPFTLSVDYTYHHSACNEPAYVMSSVIVPIDAMEFGYEFPSLNITAGVGVDSQVRDDLRLGGSFTYSYFRQGRVMEIDRFSGGSSTVSNDEMWNMGHVFGLNANAEYGVADGVDILAGLNLFYSILQSWETVDGYSPGFYSRTNTDGYALGFSGSLGLAVEFDGLVLEPFVAMGFETRRESGGRERFGSADLDAELAYDEWFVTTGISMAFDGF